MSSRIHYPHHPHFGAEVQVVRFIPHYCQAEVQVVFPSGQQLVVPQWMFDEEMCRPMQISTQPLVDLKALSALRALLDSQHLPVPQSSITSDSSSPGGESSATSGVSLGEQEP